jgi:hypothetical protein
MPAAVVSEQMIKPVNQSSARPVLPLDSVQVYKVAVEKLFGMRAEVGRHTFGEPRTLCQLTWPKYRLPLIQCRAQPDSSVVNISSPSGSTAAGFYASSCMLRFSDNLFPRILDFALRLLGVALGLLSQALRLHFLASDRFANTLASLAYKFNCFSGNLVSSAAHRNSFSET